MKSKDKNRFATIRDIGAISERVSERVSKKVTKELLDQAFSKHNETMSKMFASMMKKIDDIHQELTTALWRIGIHDKEIALLNDRVSRFESK